MTLTTFRIQVTFSPVICCFGYGLDFDDIWRGGLFDI